MLARDTQEFATQLTHHVSTSCTVNENSVQLDFSHFAELPQSHFTNQVIVKISAPQPLQFSCAETEILSVHQVIEGVNVLHSVTLSTPRRTVLVQLKCTNQTQ